MRRSKIDPQLRKAFFATVGQMFGPDDIRTRNLWAVFATELASVDSVNALAHARAELQDARERNTQLCRDLRRLEEATGKKA